MSCACRLGCTALLFWKERMLRADNTTVIVLALQERNGPAIPMHRDEIMVDMAQGIDHIPFPGTPYNIYEVPKVSFTTWVPLVFCVKDEPLRPWSRITWFSNAEKVTDRICLKNMICIFCLLSTIPCVLYLKKRYRYAQLLKCSKNTGPVVHHIILLFSGPTGGAWGWHV